LMWGRRGGLPSQFWKKKVPGAREEAGGLHYEFEKRKGCPHMKMRFYAGEGIECSRVANNWRKEKERKGSKGVSHAEVIIRSPKREKPQRGEGG